VAGLVNDDVEEEELVRDLGDAKANSGSKGLSIVLNIDEMTEKGRVMPLTACLNCFFLN